MLCILNLLDEIDCYLIRGELLSNVEGEMFVHGWIEISYEDKEYVIDTSLGRSIPLDVYYSVYNSRVYTRINREELLSNEYVQYFKEELAYPNDFTLSRKNDSIFYGEGSWFDIYENYWLENISDNIKAKNQIRRIKNC